ncbi:MAG: c-type cytochrome, partial [Gemmatimonadetes bacterium]|nr:c-type cytochrome [Gemmatimonadota bacterium]
MLFGRQLVITHDCAGCHGGAGPAGEGWLAGGSSDHIGEYTLWRPNLTPDEATGLGRFSDRQIFNALRYGLRPSATPDAEITSATPGAGGHPARPNYLSPGMPWTSWRHMSDRELWAVIAYLRHGVAPARNAVPPSEMPS